MDMNILTDDAKENVLKLIEDDLKFIETPKEILCSNCFDIPLFHYIYPCSHPYCRVCYVDVFQKHNKKCKVCKREIGQKMLQSKELEFAIYKLKVYCLNKEFGCNDEIELQNIVEHLEKCKFSKDKQLPILYNEENDTKYEDSTHLNAIKLTIGKMKTDIKDLVLTTQNFTNRFERLLKDNKRLSEVNEKLTADVQRLNGDVRILMGSSESMDRKIVELKEQMEQNNRKSKENASLVKKDFESVLKELQLQSDTIKTMGPEIVKKVDDDLQKIEKSHQNQEKKIEDQIKEVNDDFGVLEKLMVTSAKWFEVTRRNTLKILNFSRLSQKEIGFVIEDIKQWKNGSMIWQIRHYDLKRKTNASIRSDLFHYSNYGLTMRLDLTFDKNSCIYYNIQFDTDQNNESLTSGLLCRTSITILDQSDGNEKRDWTRVFEPRFGTAEEWTIMDQKDIVANSSFLEIAQNKTKYLKTDSIFIKVLVEPLHHLFGNFFSKNGILLCTIDNYERTKRESQQHINFYFYSDYFYSSEQGYRMQARLRWCDGNIVFELLFLVGENDTELPSFYSHKCTLFVVNQNDYSDKNNLLIGTSAVDAAVIGEEKTKHQMKYDCCHYFVVGFLEYEKDPFLLDNKLVFKMIVENI